MKDIILRIRIRLAKLHMAWADVAWESAMRHARNASDARAKWQEELYTLQEIDRLNLMRKYEIALGETS